MLSLQESDASYITTAWRQRTLLEQDIRGEGEGQPVLSIIIIVNAGDGMVYGNTGLHFTVEILSVLRRHWRAEEIFIAIKMDSGSMHRRRWLR